MSEAPVHAAAPVGADASGHDSLLLGSTAATATAAVTRAAQAAADRLGRAERSHSPATHDQLARLVASVDLDRPLGTLDGAVAELEQIWLEHAVWFHLPGTAAHLNCPVGIPAVAAEAMAAMVNTSMDTWDQSTSATLIERRLLAWTAELIGFPAGADGIFTPGGTSSTLQALLLARDEALELTAAAPHAPSRPERAGRLRLLASAESHFSVDTSAHILGLDDDAVVRVPVDGDGRMRPQALRRCLEDLHRQDLHPAAVIATAGTTDRGAIDPLPEIAAVCRERGIWLHVDAAYGSGLLVSPTQRGRLEGIEAADSVTLDFHKAWFQPVACSALVVREARTLRHCAHHADYLNPADTPEPNQVDRSLQTTRRFDALKLWTSLRTVGAQPLGTMVDQCCGLAREVAAAVDADPRFELVCEPSLSTVLFRWLPTDGSDPEDAVRPLRRRVWEAGRCTVAETVVAGRRCLKLTLLNPSAQPTDLLDVLEEVHRQGIAHVQGPRAADGAAR